MHACQWNRNTNISHGFVPYYLISALSFHGFFGGIYFILFYLQRGEGEKIEHIGARSIHVRTTVFFEKKAYARYDAALTRRPQRPADDVDGLRVVQMKTVQKYSEPNHIYI